MSSLKEKERAKEMQDKFQALLSALLKDEDNKYCVDCDAKGPRWASWNLGIFLCIRCAGIHRNLGVHISKVKSVNLDSWTAEQVAMMQEMGNSRARAVYEANIPDGFRRPQTDSALEAFVRSKYETKKYIAREWIPPQPKVPKEWLEDSRAEKKKTRAKPAASGVQLSSIPKVNEKPASSAATAAASSTKPASAATRTEVKMPVKAESTNSSASNDLLGLDLGQSQQCVTQQAAAPTTSGGNELLDLFGGHQAAPTACAVPPQTSGAADLMNGASAETNLFGDDAGGEDKKTSAKDSIMALFGGAGGASVSQPQMYGVPGGVYMAPGQQMYPQGVMGQNQGMMGQPQGMTGQPQAMMGQPQAMMGQQPQAMMGGQPQAMMGGQPQAMMGQPQAMMGQPQAMMGQPQAMMGQPQAMMGQPQGVMGQGMASHGMMPGQPGVMGQAAMNGSQPGMFNGQTPQMMAGSQGMYTPQQIQQLQFQQMQQQMTSMKLSGAQMGSMPQQAMPGAAAGNWSNTAASGHTLSNNLWQ